MRTNKMVSWLLVILILVSATLVYGCGQKATEGTKEGENAESPEGKDESGAQETIKIGLIAPITGDVATFGESTKNAVDLAAKQVNEKGGILGKKIEIVWEDDGNDPVQAGNAARKLITQDKVVAIVGSVSSKCSLTVAPICQENKIPMISGTSTNEKVTLVGDYIFRGCFIDSFQGKIGAKFSIEDLKAKTAACLYDLNNDYTKGLAEEFKKHFESSGGKVLAMETYGMGDQDFRAQLTKIKQVNPDVLYLSDYYQTVGLIARQARELEIKSTFVGGDGWDSPDLVPIAGEAIEDGYFTNHYSPENKTPEAVEFIDAYEAAYHKIPDALAALAYDAATILFAAIEKAGGIEGSAIRDQMATTAGFKAVSGEITFDKDRNPVKAAVILTIKDGQQKFVKMVNP